MAADSSLLQTRENMDPCPSLDSPSPTNSAAPVKTYNADIAHISDPELVSAAL